VISIISTRLYIQSPDQHKLIMDQYDYFATVPTDILIYIFSFLDIATSFSLRLTCKRFYHLLARDDKTWERLCQRFWIEYKPTSWADCVRDYGNQFSNLKVGQMLSKRPWFWFARCFNNDKMRFGYRPSFESSSYYTPEFTLGLNSNGSGDGINIGQYFIRVGTLIQNNILIGRGIKALVHPIETGWVITGGFVLSSSNGFYTDVPNGDVSIVYFNGVKIDGQWARGHLNGLGAICYPDGYRCTGQWIANMPQFDIIHPSLKECIKNKKCINNVAVISYPQKKYGEICETCWIYCMGQNPHYLKWTKIAKKCTCVKCNK
jgi:hypothetical protein